MSKIIPGELNKLREHLYRLCAPNPGPMTGPGTNTYIYGAEELAVFDPGPPLAAHIDAILATQQTLNAKITKIFVTHTHADHSPAAAKLAARLPGVKLIGAEPPAGHRSEDLSFKSDHVPSDNEVFSLDAGVVRAIHTPGHVENHFCYLFTELSLLLTGDHLMNGSTVVIIPPKGSMADYMASLRKLQNYQITTMGPGHGALIDDPAALVAWTIQHRLAREALVLAAVPTVAGVTVKELVPIVYADVPLHLHSMAALSLHAHLIKLQQDGEVVVSDTRWRRA